MTDADGIVACDWIERIVANLRRGNDAVFGRVLLDPRDTHLVPPHLHEDNRRERQLIDLPDRMAWLLDPERHDPYPRHTEARHQPGRNREGAAQRGGTRQYLSKKIAPSSAHCG